MKGIFVYSLFVYYSSYFDFRSYDLYVDGQRKIFTQSGSILAGQDIG